MKLNEKVAFSIQGSVRVYRQDIKNDRRQLLFDTHNVITYRSADMLARMMGNDPRYQPAYVGYLYGPTPTGSPMPNPGSTRDQTMSLIETELQTLGGNMIISPVNTNPDFIVDGDTSLYEGNAIINTAMSDSTSDLVYPASGGYASLPPQAGSDKYYQVVLLARYFDPGSTDPTFVPFARTQLASGTDGIVVQSASELVVFWTISFS